MRVSRRAGDWIVERPANDKPPERFYWGHGSTDQPTSPSSPSPQPAASSSVSPWKSGRKPRDADGNYLYTDANGRGLYESGPPSEPTPEPKPAPEPAPIIPPELTEWSFIVDSSVDTFNADSFGLACEQASGGSFQVTKVAPIHLPQPAFGQCGSRYVPKQQLEVRCLVTPESRPFSVASRLIDRCKVESVRKCLRYAFQDPRAAPAAIANPLEAAIRRGWDPLPYSDDGAVNPLTVTLISADRLVANSNSTNSSTVLAECEDAANVSALIEAAKAGNLTEVLRLLDQVGVPVDACVAQYRRTALHWACEAGNAQLCTKLIERHANVNFKDRSGATALHWAAWNGHPHVVELLLANGADKGVQDEDQETAAQGASDEATIQSLTTPRATGSLEAVTHELQCDPSAAGRRLACGDLALHVACRVSEDERVVELLIDYYSDALRLNDGAGGSALHNACMNRSSAGLAVVRVLLKRFSGASRQLGGSGELPLHVACRWCKEMAVAAAIHKMAPSALLAHDDRGDTPLHAAAANPDPQMVLSVLEQLYAQLAPRALAARNRRGETALLLACRYSCSVQCVLQLVDLSGPGALLVVSDRAESVLHACARNTAGAGTALAVALVAREPQLLHAEDCAGRTALTTAAANAVDPQLLRWLAESGVPTRQHASAAAVRNHHSMVECVRELTLPPRLGSTMRVSELTSSQAKELRKSRNQKEAHSELLAQIDAVNENYSRLDSSMRLQAQELQAKDLHRLLHEAEREEEPPEVPTSDWRIQVRCHVRGVYSCFNTTRFGAACRTALERHRRELHPDQLDAKIGVHATAAILDTESVPHEHPIETTQRSPPSKQSLFWVMCEVWGHVDDPGTILMCAGLLDGFKVLEAY